MHAEDAHRTVLAHRTCQRTDDATAFVQSDCYDRRPAAQPALSSVGLDCRGAIVATEISESGSGSHKVQEDLPAISHISQIISTTIDVTSKSSSDLSLGRRYIV